MKKLVAIVAVMCCFTGITFSQCIVASSMESAVAGIPDTQSQALGLANFQTENSFNIFFNPAQVTEWQTVYGEVWGGAANTWGGANTKLFFGNIGVFVGRPYTGNAGGFGANADLAVAVYGLNQGVAGPGNGAVTGNNAITGVVDNLTPLGIANNNIDIFYGKALSDDLSLGARLSLANNSNNLTWNYTASAAATSAGDGTVSLKRQSSDTQLGAGVLFKEMGPFQKLDVALTIAMPSVNNSYALSCIQTAATTNKLTESDELKSNNAANISLLGRGLSELNGNKLYTTVGYSMVDVSAKRTAVADNDATVAGNDVNKEVTYNDKTTGILLDAAYHTEPAKDIKAIYTVGIRTSSRVDEVAESDLVLGQAAATLTGPLKWEKLEVTNMSIPLSVAVEYQAWSKVCTRLGVQKNFMSSTQTKATNQGYVVSTNANLRDTVVAVTGYDNTLDPTAQAANVTLGLGITPSKDFEIDLALVSTIFDLDSGAGVSDLISRASIRYHF